MSAEFPFLGTTQALNPKTLPLFKMYAWDFNTDNFVYDGDGNKILLEGNDALKIWVIKALKTQRYRYLAYTWRYGANLQKFIGNVMSAGERKSEMKREITECLMTCPYIRSIDSIIFSEDRHQRILKVDIELTTVYGKMTV